MKSPLLFQAPMNCTDFYVASAIQVKIHLRYGVHMLTGDPPVCGTPLIGNLISIHLGFKILSYKMAVANVIALM